MGSWAPPPSTLAAFLLSLDERGATGVVPVGERRISVRRGRVVGVSPAPSDGSVAEFLRATGRIDEATLQKVASLGESQALTAALAFPEETVHEAIRAVWLERLIRALGAPGPEGGASIDEATTPEAGPTEISLGLLVLDALERLGASDAEEIGARAAGVIEWVEAPFAARAQRWLGVEGKRARRVSGVLASRPGSAARLAALARAGLVKVQESGDAPPPRPASVRAPAPPPGFDPEMGRESLAPFKPPKLELAPGAAAVLRPTLPPVIDVPRFPAATASMEDPLEPLERKIARLEETRAPAAERAKAFRALGESWLRVHGAIEETARCLREAAAADKSDVELLQRTAEACAACGQLDVALAYGRAAVAAAASPDARGATLLWYALFCRRFDRPSDALGAARAAQAVGSPNPEAYALAAELEESHGMASDSVRDLIEAATLARESHPERAHAWLARAWMLAPSDVRAAEAWAASLAARGSIEAALAVRAEAARALPDVEARRRTLLSLAERAELAERPLLAAHYQLEVLESEPMLEVVHDSVAEDLEAAGASVERALVLEDLAFRGGDESRGERSLRAAEARVATGLRPEWTLVLLRRALENGVPPTRARDLLETLRGSVGVEPICDLIEDVAHGLPNGTERRQLFDLLLAWGGGIPRGARRLARAMRERKVAEPSALASESAAEEAALATAEEKRLRATGSARRTATLELAHLLATLRDTRTRALELVESVLEEVPSDDAEDLALTIALARGQAPAILRCAARLGARSGHPEKRHRALHLALCAACELGDVRAAADAALRLTRLEPEGLEILCRVRRLGLRASDTELAVHGLRGEGAHPKLPLAARARSYARLAQLAIDGGAVTQAARAADEALSLSPSDGLAALIGLRAIARGEAPTTLLSRVREALGDVPVALAAAARAHGDAAQSLNATVVWASLEPTSFEPPLAALEESLARGIDDYLEPGVHAILTDARGTPRALVVVGRALTRIAERGEVARAAELARRAAMFFGAPESQRAAGEGEGKGRDRGASGQALRQMALDLGRRQADPFHERAALELMLPSREAVVSRIEHLERIADIARRSGERAAEVRTLLRILPLAPREPKTVQRLGQLFAETGEHERLFATLELSADDGTEAERSHALLAMAAASVQLLGDDSRANGYLDRLVALHPDASRGERVLSRAEALVALGRIHPAVELLTTEARAAVADPAQRGGSGKLFERAAELSLRHLADPAKALAIAAEGLKSGGVWTGRTLLVFEQLALESKRADLAEEVYARLAESAMGERGRRAMTYRRARWLERFGDKRNALDALVDACRQAGASGAVATALERVARDVGDLDALARGYMALAEAAKHPVLRGGLVQRAVDLWELELGRPERAFEALSTEWKKTFSSELEPALARLANAITEHDMGAGEAAYRVLFAEIERHAAEAWMGDEKARLLMKVARLHAARGDLAQAVARAREAIAALEGEDPELSRLAELWLELARWDEQRGEREGAANAVRSALAADPAHEAARAMASKLGVELPVVPAPGQDAEADDDAATLMPRRQSVPATDADDDAQTLVPRAQSVPAAPSPSSPPAGSVAPPATPASIPAAPPSAPPAPLEGLAPSPSRPPATSPSIALARPTTDDAPAASASVPAPASASSPPTASRPGSQPSPTSPSTPPGPTDLRALAAALDVEPLDLSVRHSVPPTFVPTVPLSPLAVPEAFGDDSDLPARVSRISLWAPASSPPGAPRPASLPPLSPVRGSMPPPGEAPEAFAARLAQVPATRAAAAAVLRGMLMDAPHRADLLGELGRISAEEPALSAVHHVVNGLLSLASAAPVPAPTHLDPTLARELNERLTQPGALSPCFAILERLAEALPLYRQTLGQHGVVGTDRVALHGSSPISRALAGVLALREGGEGRSTMTLDTPVFLSTKPGLLPTVLRTSPPSVLLPIDWSRSEAELRFAIGRAVELAAPRSLLLGTLSEPEAITLFDAVRAAFGPADGGRVDKNAAQLASELWRSLPVRTQRDVRELVAQAGPSWDLPSVRSAALATATRVGLIACGDVRTAVVALRRARSRTETGIESAEAWSSLLQQDAELADLVRVALSDDFLGAIRS